MLKKAVRIPLLLLAGAAAGRLLPPPDRLWSGGKIKGEDGAADVLTWAAMSHSDPAPTLERVRELSSLVTTASDVSDVLVTRVSGRTGAVEAVLLVRGDVELSVDLERARLDGVDQNARRAVLTLPPPAPLRPRIDHGRTQLVWLGRTGLWALVPVGMGDGAPEVRAVEESHRRAQAVVECAAADPVLVEQSRQRTEKVLRTFFAAAGWGVVVRWSDRP
jgi:hypothetical protein